MVTKESLSSFCWAWCWPSDSWVLHPLAPLQLFCPAKQNFAVRVTSWQKLFRFSLVSECWHLSADIQWLAVDELWRNYSAKQTGFIETTQGGRINKTVVWNTWKQCTHTCCGASWSNYFYVWASYALQYIYLLDTEYTVSYLGTADTSYLLCNGNDLQAKYK